MSGVDTNRYAAQATVFAGGIQFILGLIPNGAGTMVLCSFAFLTGLSAAVEDKALSAEGRSWKNQCSK